MVELKEIKHAIEKRPVLYRLILRMHNSFYNLFKPSYEQISNYTSYDRYPELFAFAKAYMDKRKIKEPNILSFGCSTGEECFALKEYIPEATIIGADINKKNLRIAKRKNAADTIHFVLSNKYNIEKNGPYDMVFAMSVLCRWPATKFVNNINHIYPFDRFNKRLKSLDEVLKRNGLLFITNANYRFIESSISYRYNLHLAPETVESDLVPKFSISGYRYDIPEYRTFIFEKV